MDVDPFFLFCAFEKWGILMQLPCAFMEEVWPLLFSTLHAVMYSCDFLLNLNTYHLKLLVFAGNRFLHTTRHAQIAISQRLERGEWALQRGLYNEGPLGCLFGRHESSNRHCKSMDDGGH